MELLNKEKGKDYYVITKTKPKISTSNRNNINLEELGLTKEQIVILSISGSNMYGTNTPESDEDYLGVYLPTNKQILLNDFKHTIIPPKKEGEKKKDLQIWSIHHFISLLCNGETMAMDLLHSPFDCWLIYNHHIWPWIVNNKSKFYTKEMKAFVSFARTQAVKYSIKGTMIKTCENVIKFLKEYIANLPPSINLDSIRLENIWDILPSGDHIHFLYTEPYKMYQVCGKKFHETVKITYLLNSIETHLTKYGSRAIMARNNEGVDWKAISHALRISEQAFWILKYGNYSYPLKNSKFIKLVKLGKIDFSMAKAVLEDYMDEIDKMTLTSNLPERSDKEYWKQWLIEILKEYSI